MQPLNSTVGRVDFGAENPTVILNEVRELVTLRALRVRIPWKKTQATRDEERGVSDER